MTEKEDKHIKTFRGSKLKSGEAVEAHLRGWTGKIMGTWGERQRNGQFVLTSERACFYRKGFLGEICETIPLSKITSVETSSLLGYRVLRLHTSHDELAFKTFASKSVFDKVHDRLESLRHQPNIAQAPALERTEPVTDQLKKLGELRDAGTLTEDEFSAKKAELLARL